MANAKERGRLGDILMRELCEYITALTEAGHDWEAVWAWAVWPPDSRLRWLHGRFLLARECAAMIGHRFTDEEITQFGREQLAYLAQYPAGLPSLTDE
ncbi:hypothetical protein [Streptomyces tirandamycinicus]|uniref:Uncharacterized protein n=1 Tax=Streptomyces tirandamycinicus TaxID=2174846 RepID=A0A2S1T1X3_9ACTN|nr:hypothetical protein [Streptomyces tirandamycinicus]AWI32650.1 hypothetical protein DDW44_30490 [Streptomyces tirandamycinicus]